MRKIRIILALSALISLTSFAQAQKAGISEEQRSLKTYPFSDPNPIPILSSNPKIYPYFKYEGYSRESKPQDWKVITLENDYIEVSVLPQVGGKVWGAIEKSTGEEFIYRNEVMKFRNISMRGPWTSGGIEFNFGIIGHHPSTATPVDYVIQELENGDVSCTVGNIDLPSRTQWRVKILLPKDKASFETQAIWYNPTPLHQAYYNWMTAAAFATEDLEFYTPGDQYLKHSGEAKAWPFDERERDLSRYKENDFGSSKSYHVVGEYNDFFGGYFQNAAYGFGHWAEYEEMPGQKLWLWALSRSGEIWEDLLTDTDGQYIEFQAGRLFVQYSPGEHVNPITQATFPPYTTDTWREVWFPVKEIGGMSDVSQQAVLHVEEQEGALKIGVNALAPASGTLEVFSGDQLLFREKLDLSPMGVFSKNVSLKGAKGYEVRIKEMDLSFSSEPEKHRLQRPFDSGSLPFVERSAEKRYREGLEDQKFRSFIEAEKKFRQCLEIDPYHGGAMVQLALLYYDRGLYEQGLKYARQALRLDAYDPHANFAAGVLYRAQGDWVNAKESMGWAARSMTYRSAAYAQMAEIHLLEKDYARAAHFAQKSLDFNRYNVNARQVLAIQARKTKDKTTAIKHLKQLLDIDPLSHFAYFEQYLLSESAEDQARFKNAHRSELPVQTYLELAIAYANNGLKTEAVQVLEAAPQDPMIDLWYTYLRQDSESKYFSGLTKLSPAFVFPFRRETLQALEWANEHSDDWRLKYYLALNLWAKDRLEEAAEWMDACGDAPDYGYFYAARADLLQKHSAKDPLADLKKAHQLNQDDWRSWHMLNEYYFDKQDYGETLKIAGEAARRFPNNYVAGTDLSRVLVYRSQYEEAAKILENIQVLPFEGASESRRLYEWAHLGRALNLIKKQEYQAATQALANSRKWPENLGVGRPYEPEERLQDFLLAFCYEKTNAAEKAQKIQQKVLERTQNTLTQASPLHLLGLAVAKKTDADVAYNMAALLQQSPQAKSPQIRWALARFYSNEKELAPLKKEYPRLWVQPGMILLEEALKLDKQK